MEELAVPKNFLIKTIIQNQSKHVYASRQYGKPKNICQSNVNHRSNNLISLLGNLEDPKTISHKIPGSEFLIQ